MNGAQDALSRLRALAGMSAHRAGWESFGFGAEMEGLPALGRGAIHEILAAGKADAPAAAGFVAGLALRAGGKNRAIILWVRHADERAGALYGDGVAALGLDPCALIHVPVADEKDALRAAIEGLRCKGLASVVLEIAGPARHLDLTTTRRMKLAAAEHGVTGLILRRGTDPGPSAAQTRWRVAGALSASPGLDLPGNPAFTVTLLKHRSLETGRTWELEWDHETRRFAPKALPRPVAALSFDRTHPAAGEGLRTRAG